MKTKKADIYEKHACDFKNEEECEEEVEEDGLTIGEVEVDHFDEDHDLKTGEE